MTNERLTTLATFLVLALMLAVSVWWLPQKWEGCQKIYENRLAQIICFSSK